MARALSTLLLLTGATLLVTWLSTPAVSAPSPQAVPPRTAMDDVAPLVSDVDAEVLSLHDRLTTPPAYPEPARDPFSYAARPMPPRVRDARPAVAMPAAPVVVPETPRPTLVAILSGDDAAAPRAVFALPGEDADVHFVAAGASIGGFVVSDVQDDAVVLTDPRTNTTTRLTLR
jgi:hypothetical protein